MAEYLYIYRSDAATARQWQNRTPQEMQENMQRWVTWLKSLGDKGHLKDAGQPLDQGGKVVTGKKKAVTDGPYVEKDLVGGYSLIIAKDLAQATELSMGCPIFESGGSVEVRPVILMQT
jgi:hypothetical protein